MTLPSPPQFSQASTPPYQFRTRPPTHWEQSLVSPGIAYADCEQKTQHIKIITIATIECFMTFLPVPAPFQLEARHLRHMTKERRARSPFQTSAGRKTETSPMHHERSLREPTTIQRRRRDCTDGSVLLLRRCFRVGFSGLSRDASHGRRVGGHAGRVTLPLHGKSVLPRRTGSNHFALAVLVYQKIRSVGGNVACDYGAYEIIGLQ